MNIETLRAMLPKGSLVTLNYDDCEPEPITGHKMTKLNGPQVRLGSRWYYLYQLRDGRALLTQWRKTQLLVKCVECQWQGEFATTAHGECPQCGADVDDAAGASWTERDESMRRRIQEVKESDIEPMNKPNNLSAALSYIASLEAQLGIEPKSPAAEVKIAS